MGIYRQEEMLWMDIQKENQTLKSEAMLMLCCILDPGSSQEWRQNMIDHCWKGRRKMIAQNSQQSNF